MTTFPFEVPFEQIQADPETYIMSVFSCLESEFLVLPKGAGFIGYSVFETGYETLKQATSAFTNMTLAHVYPVAVDVPIALIILMTMLGFTPPEWAYITTQRSGITVTQGFVRSLDRNIRMAPHKPLGTSTATTERVQALIETACQLLSEGAPKVEADQIHRLDKADTRAGLDTVGSLAQLGVPYAMLLYERFLGCPFAAHRDSVSELVGGGMESAIEDDGTARDKVTRVQHLNELSMAGQPADQPNYEVIACIGGRGFGVRREDMRKLLDATRGKVFTLKTLDRLVECSRLREFRTK